MNTELSPRVDWDPFPKVLMDTKLRNPAKRTALHIQPVSAEVPIPSLMPNIALEILNSGIHRYADSTGQTNIVS